MRGAERSSDDLEEFLWALIRAEAPRRDNRILQRVDMTGQRDVKADG